MEKRAERKSAKDIAEMDAREYDEPKGEVLRSPGTGGDPEHKEPLKNDENTLTT